MAIVTNIRNKIKRSLKFFKSLIGKIVFALIAILIIVLLVYVIVGTILKSVAKIVGVDLGAQSRNESYEFLKELTNSGYDAMLNSKELVEYSAFEYAVLMDAARFMEETGTIPFEVKNEADFDMEALGSLGEPAKREVWAYLAAAGFVTDRTALAPADKAYMEQVGEKYKSVNDKQKDILKKQQQQQNQQNQQAGGSYGGGFINTGDFDTSHTEENLFYSPTYNEYTKETALNPYLKITRTYDIVKYYVEIRDKGGAISKDVLTQGTGYNLGSANDSSALLQFFQGSRFEFGFNGAYAGFGSAYQFFLDYVYPSQICTELNANNTAAYEQKAKEYNGTPGTADLYKEYSESLYYSTGSTPTEHIIPLRMLLERFLPNAVLLSSWRILKDDTQSTEDVVDEIQKIYTEACLKDETASGDKLLVKDVFAVSTNIDENTKAVDLFDKVTLQDTAKENYLTGEKTNLLYNSYEALFDSRIWGENTQKSQSTATDSNDLEAIVQTFEGGFSGDVIDDIKLVLTHYSENCNINLNKNTYERLVQDAEKVINPSEDMPISMEDKDIKDGEYILYTPLSNGTYLVKCNATENDNQFKAHYNLNINADVSDKEKIMKENNHKGYRNPYSESAEIKECFVPFMKVAFTHKDGLRMTAIIIHNDGEYTGYIVKGKEIVDYSRLSNKNTFAYFESRDMKCTTVRHWKIATTGESSEEKWVVTDAFEGMSLEADALSLDIYYYSDENPNQAKYTTITASLEEWNRYLGTDLYLSDLMSGISVNGKKIKDEDILPEGSLAIVRTNTDPKDRNYTDEMLALPTDASLSSAALGNYNYSDPMTGGETIVTDKSYIKLKNLGFESGDTISRFDTSAAASEITNIISNYKLLDLLVMKLLRGNGFKFSDLSNPNYVSEAAEYENEHNIRYANRKKAELENIKFEFAVVFPTERRIIPITQEFWDKTMRFYLVKGAKTWSGIKTFNNKISIVGEFANRNNYMYVVTSNKYCKGINEYNCTMNAEWRCKLFAPIFAGDDSANTNARETDVQLILSEWLEASKEGIQAADYYIRDLYALINYSKGIKNEDGTYAVKPIYKSDGTPYINPGSYTYLYIPDEIIQFDETTPEKAFFEDRLICTPQDPIEPSENYLRSQAETFTWQIVDYDLYEECRNADGTSSVYPLWMFSDQMSRSLYAIAANANAKEHEKVLSGWGGFASGFHAAADLYGRTQSTKIYNEVFDENGNARIKATYSNGKVTLSGTDSTAGEPIYIGYNEKAVDIDSTAGNGLYFIGAQTKLKLGDKEYTFNGTAAAVYGYELYRQTLILKSPEKAEASIKKQLEKEKKWTAIRAVAPGIVISVKGDARGGFAVKIQHTETTTTSYLHMKRYPLVQVGQYVGAGTLLGYEGTTGNSGGFHVHFSMYKNGEALNPVTYLYPFFTPFYYAEKAEAANYELDSEYMSLARTVFPYGQIAGPYLPKLDDEDDDVLKLKDEEGNNPMSAFRNDDNTVKIRNYVPWKTFIEDSSQLLDENSGYEGYKDFSKLPVTKVTTDLGASDYSGEDIETNPDYFDKDFIKAVQKNGSKITGAKALMLQERNANKI